MASSNRSGSNPNALMVRFFLRALQRLLAEFTNPSSRSAPSSMRRRAPRLRLQLMGALAEGVSSLRRFAEHRSSHGDSGSGTAAAPSSRKNTTPLSSRTLLGANLSLPSSHSEFLGESSSSPFFALAQQLVSALLELAQRAPESDSAALIAPTVESIPPFEVEQTLIIGDPSPSREEIKERPEDGDTPEPESEQDPPRDSEEDETGDFEEVSEADLENIAPPTSLAVS